MEQTLRVAPVRICAHRWLPNHWHFVLWPERDGDLSGVMQRMANMHTQRWQRAKLRVGYGHLYQGRFKSFPIESDEHFYSCGAVRGAKCLTGRDLSSARRIGNGEVCSSVAGGARSVAGTVAAARTVRLGRTGQLPSDRGGIGCHPSMPSSRKSLRQRHLDRTDSRATWPTINAPRSRPPSQEPFVNQSHSVYIPVYAPVPLCVVIRLMFSVGAIPTRQRVAAAGSNRSDSGGNEAAEAFDGKGCLGQLREQAGRNASERRAGLETSDVGADPTKGRGRPSLQTLQGATGVCGPTGVMAMACLHRETSSNTRSPSGDGA